MKGPLHGALNEIRQKAREIAVTVGFQVEEPSTENSLRNQEVIVQSPQESVIPPPATYFDTDSESVTTQQDREETGKKVKKRRNRVNRKIPKV